MGSSISNGPTIPIPKAGSVRSPARAASATHEPASVFCDSPFHLRSSRQPWYLLPSSICAGSRNPPSTTTASSSSHRDPSTAFSPCPTKKTAQQHLHRISGPWQVGPESTRKTLLQRANGPPQSGCSRQQQLSMAGTPKSTIALVSAVTPCPNPSASSFNRPRSDGHDQSKQHPTAQIQSCGQKSKSMAASSPLSKLGENRSKQPPLSSQQQARGQQSL
ncbi:hypothetical protein ACLOJK_006883 [Asimina triloba]